MARKRRYLDDTLGTKIVSRSDNTYGPTAKVIGAINQGYDRMGAKAYTPKERLTIIHNKQSYNVHVNKTRKETIRGIGYNKEEQSKYNAKRNKQRKFDKAQEQLASSIPYHIINAAKQQPPQLYDKDKLDLANIQADAILNNATSIGTGYQQMQGVDKYNPNIANLYNTQGVANVVPYTLPLFGAITPNMTAPVYIGSTIGGEIGGHIGNEIGGIVSNNKYAPVIGSLIGGIVGGIKGNKITTSWNNPNSLWSKNIRTAFANDKIPFGYDVSDKQNILPYIKGTYKTLLGKKIPLKNRIDAAIDLFKWVPRRGDETINEYVARAFRHDGGGEVYRDFASKYNRLGAFRKYLGVGKDKDNLQMLTTDEKLHRYFKRADGTYDFPFTNEEEKSFLYLMEPKVTPTQAMFRQEVPALTYDLNLGNHANVGAKLKYYGKDVVAEIIDPWDLHPQASLNEMSSYLPAGAKPFTLKHVIPISKKYKKLDILMLNSSGYPTSYKLNNLYDVVDLLHKNGTIIDNTSIFY